MQLVIRKIVVGPQAFVGARAFILPGIAVGARAIVGAASVVTRDVPPSAVVAGNPTRFIRMRFEAEA
jgi:putative colanic acid biosynthesis acetyltransferase WcaF